MVQGGHRYRCRKTRPLFSKSKGGGKTEEKKVGEVIKFFGKIGVAAIRLSESLKAGDKIHIMGHTSDATLTVDSMQVENASVQEAGPGTDIGIKMKEKVREHDIVYKVVE
jgi:putative protease